MTSFLQKLAHLFQPGQAESPYFEFRVRCNRCGEEIHGKIHRYNDLSLDESEESGSENLVCRKIVTGSGENRCFQRVEVYLQFDSKRKLQNHEVAGGTWLE
ncbi:MAG: hypothetical protein OHK0052_10510 [Anaerolineales bacterium]